jgi:AcrR family transcriptional regulator
VATRARVRRATVYRHFPDEVALFQACSSHWTAANPLPDVGRWAAVQDPEKRLSVALTEVYAYYNRTEGMMANVLRDESTMPLVKHLLRGHRLYLSAARDAVLHGRNRPGRANARVRAAIGHALAFATWRSLVREERLHARDAVDLMCRLATDASCDVSGRARVLTRGRTSRRHSR